MKSFLLLLACLCLPLPSLARPAPDPAALGAFIDEMATQHDFDRRQLEALFAKVKLHQSILDAISRPAESKPWKAYRPIFLTADRRDGGVHFWREHADLLARARETYGVPEEIIVAIIGVETRYGRHAGRFHVLDALSTLAFAYPPRARFFRNELKEYLLMTQEERLPPQQQLGSYAGAMGMPQFMPSAFRQYAVDFDGDGKRDLWNNPADAVGSVANYLYRHHWHPGEPIAHRVRVHGKRWRKLIDGNLEPHYSQDDLLALGVVLPQGLPAHLKGALIELEGANGPEHWVVWHNFHVISRYNRSALYAMAVYQLSQAIRRHYRE